MATTFHRAESALANLPPHFAPMPAVMRTLAQFDRPQLAGFITVAIGLLDLMDGDSDFEGQCNEDEISRCTDLGLAVRYDGPGCQIADPDTGVDDDPEGVDEGI